MTAGESKTNTTDPVRVAVTGGPGAGKTSLLAGLRSRGYAVVPEVARAIIAERTSRGLPPRPEPRRFARMMIDRDIEQYRSVPAGASFIFFDRSLLDSLGLLAQLNQLPDADRSRYLAQYPYHPVAFILPPWREIYRTDAERDQTFEQAVSVYRSLRDWYTECGYDLIEVPAGTVDQRCELVMRSLREAPR